MISRITSELTLDPFSRNSVTIPLPLYIQLSGASYGNNGLAGQLDNYMIYVYKVKRCSRNRSHDWTACPYAHRGEKAKRRDPRKFSYHGIACPNWRRAGECPRGSKCDFSHGVFEYWLHPSRYRTRLCESGEQCTRKVCFFAHSVQQLRAEMPQLCVGCEHVTAAAAQRGAHHPQDPEEMMDEPPVRCVVCVQAAARVGKAAMAAAAGPAAAAGMNLRQQLLAGPFVVGSRPPRFTAIGNTSKRFAAAVGKVASFEDQVDEPEWVDDLVN